ncbi:hypothetical protein NO1_0383 [Candidatus Termititenax aidoneus]|uniref:Uncharacterized protein n=1 Tax=Termititenax aidoneus TaxID=2218524 RepID=A0A388T8H5_TERA1|nr:hypothetical protein NO1_0383 [Candidatus Termititenax aidoneus]
MRKNVLKFLVIGAAALASIASAAPGWFIQTDVNQDFRYRLQEDTQDIYKVADDSMKTAHRYRERIRYRLGLTSKINEEFTAGARLATGALNNTKSVTQTLGDSGSTNPFGNQGINLDQAYLSYAPKWVPEVTGKFKAIIGKFDLKEGIYTTTTVAWDSNISLEGKNLNYNYKNLGVEGLDLFANVGSYVLNHVNGISAYSSGTGLGVNANLEVQQLGLKWKILRDYSLETAYTQYAVPFYDNTVISYFGDKAANQIAAKIGANLSVPYFEKVALLYDDFTNPNDNKDNKAKAYGLEFGTAKVAKLGDYSLRYLNRRLEKNLGWDFTDDAHSTKNTEGEQITLVLGLVENVSFTVDYYKFKGIDDTDRDGNDLSDSAKAILNSSSTRFEINVKF